MNFKHLYVALRRQGVSVNYQNGVYRLKSASSEAQVLMPESLPLPARAVAQLLAFADVRTPGGESAVHCACAMPDFHPGELAPVGSVVATEPDFVIPQSIGTDINCGMRLVATGLTEDAFKALQHPIIQRLTRTLLVASRDVPVPGEAFKALFDEGPAPFIEALAPEGLWAHVDKRRLLQELSPCAGLEGLKSASRYVPPALLGTERALIRDPQFATVGSGNHFVEFAVCSQIEHRPRAWQEKVVPREVFALIHSGSRAVGQYVGKRWMAWAREAWPEGLPHPESGLYGLSGALAEQYLAAMGAAARYAWANRVALAELVRDALRDASGADTSRLIVDVPHNVILSEDGLNIHRKGSTVAHAGQLALIPGSMGSASYLVEGLGHSQWLASCSHGAGRAIRRQKARRLSPRKASHAWECVTLRESRAIEEDPSAYKPIEEVIEAQKKAGLIRPVARFMPLLTFKA